MILYWRCINFNHLPRRKGTLALDPGSSGIVFRDPANSAPERPCISCKPLRSGPWGSEKKNLEGSERDFLRLERRRNQSKAPTIIIIPANEIPTPMPAFAPVVRPEEQVPLFEQPVGEVCERLVEEEEEVVEGEVIEDDCRIFVEVMTKVMEVVKLFAVGDGDEIVAAANSLEG